MCPALKIDNQNNFSSFCNIDGLVQDCSLGQHCVISIANALEIHSLAVSHHLVEKKLTQVNSYVIFDAI